MPMIMVKNEDDTWRFVAKSSDEYMELEEIERGSDDWHMLKGTKQTYALAELKRFQMERELHLRPFDKRVCTMNIMEELLEMWGVGDNDDRELVKDLMWEFERTVNRIIFKEDNVEPYQMEGFSYSEPTEYDEVDALCDIQTFAGGDVMKIGYDNEKCLAETAKEVNSRKGEIIEGKFQKYKTPEAKALWYKADYSGCKL